VRVAGGASEIPLYEDAPYKSAFYYYYYYNAKEKKYKTLTPPGEHNYGCYIFSMTTQRSNTNPNRDSQYKQYP